MVGVAAPGVWPPRLTHPDTAAGSMNSLSEDAHQPQKGAPKVVIRTGSRLHFGFFSVNQPTERHFGGIGLMIDSPGVELTASPLEAGERDLARLGEDSTATRDDLERILKSAAMFRESRTDVDVPTCQFTLQTAIPSHRGLGSGTQLGLAVGRALSVLCDEPLTPTTDVARRVGRGARSAVGIYGFEHGGFIVDGGSKDSRQIGELSQRCEFPDNWRFVLVWPPDRAGLSGSEEQTAFRDLPPMPQEMTSQLRSLTTDIILPAIEQASFESAARGLRDFGFVNGEYFVPIQGGVFANSRTAALAEHLQQSGFDGVGQSSWGPSMWVLCPDESTTQQLVRDLRTGDWSDCDFTISRPRNGPAEVEVPSQIRSE